MADYGAMILLDNGNPFVTPQSTPFCLYRKVVVNSGSNGVAVAEIPIDPAIRQSHFAGYQTPVRQPIRTPDGLAASFGYHLPPR